MVIGLMGGVGCGKSTILGYLEKTYDACIIEADKVAKEIMNPGNEVYDEVAKAFPEVIKNGYIDRKILADIVFTDEKKLIRLNTITHPGTIKKISKMIEEAENELIVLESAILIDSGLEEYCDELWFVYCDLETRIARLINNRGYSREKCIHVMKNQPQDEEYNTFADEYIDNSYSEERTKEQIDIILSKKDC